MPFSDNNNDSDINSSVTIPTNPTAGVLVRQSRDSMPLGAIRLSPHEVRNIQRQRIRSWHPQEEVWPLRYGSRLLTFSTAICGYFTLLRVRRHFQLTSQRLLTTIGPAVGLPLMFIPLAYHMAVEDPILKGYVKCPLCYEARGSLIQVTLGALFPFVNAVLICMPVARMEKTYPVPAPTDVRGILNVARLSARSSWMSFAVIGSLQILFGGWMAKRAIETQAFMLEKDEGVVDIVQNIALEIPVSHSSKL